MSLYKIKGIFNEKVLITDNNTLNDYIREFCIELKYPKHENKEDLCCLPNSQLIKKINLKDEKIERYKYLCKELINNKRNNEMILRDLLIYFDKFEIEKKNNYYNINMDSLVNKTQAENVKEFVDNLANDKQFKKILVDKINENTDIPLCSEKFEEKIFSALYDCVIDVLQNAVDKLCEEKYNDMKNLPAESNSKSSK
tara:strand:- start:851 stop:1444 length:594 start_codon:yes stop_codon:yes gene_type:complete